MTHKQVEKTGTCGRWFFPGCKRLAICSGPGWSADWPWFLFSHFLFAGGLSATLVVNDRSPESPDNLPAALLAGLGASRSGASSQTVWRWLYLFLVFSYSSSRRGWRWFNHLLADERGAGFFRASARRAAVHGLSCCWFNLPFRNRPPLWSRR